MEHRKVLVIDDLKHIESMIQSGLLYYPLEMSFSTSKNDAITQILRQPPDLLVSGLVFSDGTAVELINEVVAMGAVVPPGIFLADANQIEVQKEIIKLGAVDILERPFEMSMLHVKIDHAVTVMNMYNVKSRLESFVKRSQKSTQKSSDEFEKLLEESKNLGIPIAELIKLKQLSN